MIETPNEVALISIIYKVTENNSHKIKIINKITHKSEKQSFGYRIHRIWVMQETTRGYDILK